MLISISESREIGVLTKKEFVQLGDADKQKYLEEYPNSSFRRFFDPDKIKKIHDFLGMDKKRVEQYNAEPGVKKLMSHSEKIFDTIDTIMKIPNSVLRKGFEKLHKTKAIQKLQKGTMKADQFLNKNPFLKKMGGPLVAGALAYQWLNMSFSGDFDDDFNLDNLVNALQGDYSLEELIATPDGLKGLAQLAAGIATGGLLSFPWHKKMNIAFAAAYTGARRLGDSKGAQQMFEKFRNKLGPVPKPLEA
jgi:hypothetical protein